jgi:hypothetical protein
MPHVVPEAEKSVDLPSTHRDVSMVWAETGQSLAKGIERGSKKEKLLWPKHAIPIKTFFFGESGEFQFSLLSSSVCAT